MTLLHSFIYTFAHRPYILAFLLAFFVVGFLNIGVWRTFLFLVIGYSVALLSEASSIRTGFPYGWYEYLYDAMPGELMVWGVPVWDSLSYVFMTFASWRMAKLIIHYWFGAVPRWLRPSRTSSATPRGTDPEPFVVIEIFATAFFTVLLDMLADPLALRGDQWFLGKIYRYPVDGFYFGIPLSNFIGWFFVATVIIVIYLWRTGGEWGLSSAGSQTAVSGRETPEDTPETGPVQWAKTLGPLLYLSLVLFNLILTLWIGEFLLAACGFILVSLSLLLTFFLHSRLRHS